MKYRIDDPKVLGILKRNHISYWPDVRERIGSDFVLSRGMGTRLQDGSHLENRNGKLILKHEGTAPAPGLLRLPFSRRCETGWNSTIDEQCCNMTKWQYNGDAVCIGCMRALAAMKSDNAEVFQPALQIIERSHGNG